MYERLPENDEPDAFGFTRADFTRDDIEIWPENLQAYEVFNALGTQWRIGMGGPTGLDYQAVETVLRLRRVPRADWSDLFDDIRVMEQQALQTMRQG